VKVSVEARDHSLVLGKSKEVMVLRPIWSSIAYLLYVSFSVNVSCGLYSAEYLS